MNELTSINGGKIVKCEHAENYIHFIRELKKEGFNDEFIKHAVTALSGTYAALYSPSLVIE